MDKKKITNMEVKKKNRNEVFRYICKQGTVSNPDISYNMKISLPTATQITKELMAEGLLEEKGHFWFLGSGNARDEIMEKWEMAGIESEEKATIMIERYWFNIYYCRLKTENSNSIKISE